MVVIDRTQLNLVEFYKYTYANAVIWFILVPRTFDCLSHCTLSDISVQWLELVYEKAKFVRFAKVLEKEFDENE